MRRKKLRISLGVVLFLFGIALIGYPWLDRYWQKQQQVALLTQWEQSQAETSLASNTVAIEDEQEKERQQKQIGDMMGVIEIDKIELKEPVVVGSTQETLRVGIGTVVPERSPGQIGNFALAGHRAWTYGHQFNRLDELAEGDEITIATDEERYTYRVTSTSIVTPDDLSVLDEDGAKSEVTLITCEPMYKATHRLIVKAEIVNEHRALTTK